MKDNIWENPKEAAKEQSMRKNFAAALPVRMCWSWIAFLPSVILSVLRGVEQPSNQE